MRAACTARVLACTRADFDTHLGSLGEIRNMWRFEALRKVGRAAAELPAPVLHGGLWPHSHELQPHSSLLPPPTRTPCRSRCWRR